MDKEGTYVVMLSANLQFTVRNIHSVLALAAVALEDESVFVCIERVPDLIVFAEERVLFECSEIALTPSGFVGLIPDEVWFVQCVVVLEVLEVLVILLFNLSFFNFLLFLALFFHLLPPFLEVFVPG